MSNKLSVNDISNLGNIGSKMTNPISLILHRNRRKNLEGFYIDSVVVQYTFQNHLNITRVSKISGNELPIVPSIYLNNTLCSKRGEPQHVHQLMHHHPCEVWFQQGDGTLWQSSCDSSLNIICTSSSAANTTNTEATNM
jgi:hypothetical protein